jgi:hypothetical protein
VEDAGAVVRFAVGTAQARKGQASREKGRGWRAAQLRVDSNTMDVDSRRASTRDGEAERATAGQ